MSFLLDLTHAAQADTCSIFIALSVSGYCEGFVEESAAGLPSPTKPTYTLPHDPPPLRDPRHHPHTPPGSRRADGSPRRPLPLLHRAATVGWVKPTRPSNNHCPICLPQRVGWRYRGAPPVITSIDPLDQLPGSTRTGADPTLRNDE